MQTHHVSEINAPAVPGKLGRGILPEKLDRCGQLASKNPYPIDRFMLKGTLWVIRANFTSADETYTAGRETPILGLPAFLS